MPQLNVCFQESSLLYSISGTVYHPEYLVFPFEYYELSIIQKVTCNKQKSIFIFNTKLIILLTRLKTKKVKNVQNGDPTRSPRNSALRALTFKLRDDTQLNIFHSLSWLGCDCSTKRHSLHDHTILVLNISQQPNPASVNIYVILFKFSINF